jgi:hypothetical protein
MMNLTHGPAPQLSQSTIFPDAARILPELEGTTWASPAGQKKLAKRDASGKSPVRFFVSSTATLIDETKTSSPGRRIHGELVADGIIISTGENWSMSDATSASSMLTRT